MISRLMAAGALVLVWAAAAADPQLLTVASSNGEAVFFQLEASGRKQIAADDRRVGLVWEESRGGQSSSYLAFKPLGKEQVFGAPQLLAPAASSPVIARCGGHFYVAWIEPDRVRASSYAGEQRGATVELLHGVVNELTIACRDNSALFAWSRPTGTADLVEVGALQAEQDGLRHTAAVPVAPLDTYHFQTNPGVAYAKGRVIVSWHDRSSGTNLLYTSSARGLDRFDPPVQVNELIQKSEEWGSGSSAVRNALAVVEGQRLVAVWLDKRSSRTGYKVYAAFSHDGGISWGDNYEVIDEWGAVVPQWTPAMAADGRDRLQVVWMDAREDDTAIWCASLDGLSWGANTRLSGAARDVHSPVIAYGPDGTLHAAWIDTDGANRRLRYFSESD
jgi:hypothetical protein